MQLFDTNIYTEPDGSKWVRVFHHNPSNGGFFSSSDDFLNGVYHNENCWFQMSYFDTATEYEIMVKQMKTADGTPEKYRWIQSANPMTAEPTDVLQDKLDINDEGYIDFSDGGFYRQLYGPATYINQMDGHPGDYWGAVGLWEGYNGGIPAFDRKGVVVTGYLDVYARLQSTITTDKEELSIAFDGGTDSFKVSCTEGSWEAIVDSDWISIDRNEGTVGDTIVNVSVEANKGLSREGTITLVNGDDTVVVFVKQDKAHLTTTSRNFYSNGRRINKVYINGENVYKRLARTPKLEVSTEELSVNSVGGIVPFSIESNSRWEILCDADWLHFSKTSGKDKDTIYVTCDESNEERTADILVKGLGEARELSHTIVFTQKMAYYTVKLNDNWRLSETIPNPDSNLYEGVYESFSNWHIASRSAVMYVDIDGYDTFSLYVRSFGEGGWDFIRVSELDSNVDKFTTKNIPNSGTDINSYSLVTFENIPEGTHRITITYGKDGSGDAGDDRGYLLIPIKQ